MLTIALYRYHAIVNISIVRRWVDLNYSQAKDLWYPTSSWKACEQDLRPLSLQVLPTAIMWLSYKRVGTKKVLHPFP